MLDQNHAHIFTSIVWPLPAAALSSSANSLDFSRILRIACWQRSTKSPLLWRLKDRDPLLEKSVWGNSISYQQVNDVTKNMRCCLRTREKRVTWFPVDLFCHIGTCTNTAVQCTCTCIQIQLFILCNQSGRILHIIFIEWLDLLVYQTECDRSNQTHK